MPKQPALVGGGSHGPAGATAQEGSSSARCEGFGYLRRGGHGARTDKPVPALPAEEEAEEVLHAHAGEVLRGSVGGTPSAVVLRGRARAAVTDAALPVVTTVLCVVCPCVTCGVVFVMKVA